MGDEKFLSDLGRQLLEAAKLGRADELLSLMSRGALFTTDWLGMSALHLAAQNGHLTIVATLLSSGVCRDARNKVKRTPLHLAAGAGHAPIVQILLDHGTDIQATDMLLMTPLHLAALSDNIDTVKILLERGALAMAKNKFDKTPVDLATSQGLTDIVNLLMSAMTSPRVKVEEVARCCAVMSLVASTRPSCNTSSCNTDCVSVLLNKQTTARIVPVTTKNVLISKLLPSPQHGLHSGYTHFKKPQLTSKLPTTPDNHHSSNTNVTTATTTVRANSISQVNHTAEQRSNKIAISLSEQNSDQHQTDFLLHQILLSSTRQQPAGHYNVKSNDGEEKDNGCWNNADVSVMSSDRLMSSRPTNCGLVTAALNSGQNLVLTEEGKLALKRVVIVNRRRKILESYCRGFDSLQTSSTPPHHSTLSSSSSALVFSSDDCGLEDEDASTTSSANKKRLKATS